MQTHAGPVGYILQFSPLLALLSWALIPLSWRKRGSLLPLPVAMVLALWGVAMVALVVFTRGAYDQTAKAVLQNTGGIYEEWRSRAWQNWSMTYRYGALGFGLALFAGAIPLTIVVALRASRSERSGAFRAPSAIVTVFAGLAVLVISATLTRTVLAFSRAHLECVELYLPSCRYPDMVGAFGATEEGRTVLIGLSVLATIAAVAWPSADLVPISRFGLRGGLATLAAGSLAWFLARPLAYDAAHPLALQEPPQTGCPAAPGGRSCELPDIPKLTIEGGVVSMGGSPEADPIRGLRMKRELWAATNPGRKFPGTVSFLVEPSTPMTLAGPLLEAVQKAGYAKADIALDMPRVPANTRTLGAVPRSACYCTIETSLDTPWLPSETWGTWVLALQGTRTAKVP